MDSTFDALVAARERIKELEGIVAVLTEKIKMMEIKNLSWSPAAAPYVSGTTTLYHNKVENVSTQSAVQYSPGKGDDQSSGRKVEFIHEMELDAREQQGEDIFCPATKDTSLSQEHSAMKGKKGNGGNVSAPATRHVALKIMYWGSRFQGFAFQSGSQVTVESELFVALRRTKLLIGDLTEANYSRCGRTDKGVSATGQVVALKLRTNCRSLVDKEGRPSDTYEDFGEGDKVFSASTPGTAEVEDTPMDRVAAARASRGFEESVSSNFEDEGEIEYIGVLNRVLPDDIRIVGWCPVPNGFHARFSCLYREYKYFFLGGKLDIPSMKLAASKFLGEHDFRNFCKMDAANVHNYRRTVTELDIVPVSESWGERQLWVMRVKGTAFLWHQIRCMAAVLFMVGQGHESPEIVDDLLAHSSNTTRKPQYTMASEKPLVLSRCGFRGLNFHCTPRAMKHVQSHLEKLLDQALVHVSLIQEALQELPSAGTGDTEDINKLKRMHIPLSLRQTEPSYEERKTKLNA